ncbi:MAG: hypothetical protein RR277_09760, partial [Rikenellaceae bacterium]
KTDILSHDIGYSLVHKNAEKDTSEFLSTGEQNVISLILFLISYKEYDITPTFEKNKVVKMQSCKYFETNVIEVDGSLERDYAVLDSFVIYIAVEGKVQIKYDEGTISVSCGESILIPASISDVVLQGHGKLIEVYIP